MIKVEEKIYFRTTCGATFVGKNHNTLDVFGEISGLTPRVLKKTNSPWYPLRIRARFFPTRASLPSLPPFPTSEFEIQNSIEATGTIFQAWSIQ